MWLSFLLIFPAIPFVAQDNEFLASLHNGGVSSAAFDINIASGVVCRPGLPSSLSSPTLSITNLISGGTATFAVSYCTPGSYVFPAYSIWGSGPTSTPWGDVMLSQPIKRLAPIAVGSTGKGMRDFSVPPGISGLRVWVQALDYGTLILTNPLALTIQ